MAATGALKSFEISFVDVTLNGIITLNVKDTSLSVYINKGSVDLYGTTGLIFGVQFSTTSGAIIYGFNRVLTSWIINHSSYFVAHSYATSKGNYYIGGYESNQSIFMHFNSVNLVIALRLD